MAFRTARPLITDKPRFTRSKESTCTMSLYKEYSWVPMPCRLFHFPGQGWSISTTLRLSRAISVSALFNAFATWSPGARKTHNILPFDSGARQPPAHLRWSLHVSLPYRTSSSCCQLLKHEHVLKPSSPAGNSPLLSAMNGASFGAVVPTSGQYGCVIAGTSVFGVSSFVPESLRLIHAFGRSTRLHAWQPSRLHYLLWLIST
jgi:hypothetical protein